MEITYTKYTINCSVTSGDGSRILKTYLRDPKRISEIHEAQKSPLQNLTWNEPTQNFDHHISKRNIIRTFNYYIILHYDLKVIPYIFPKSG